MSENLEDTQNQQSQEHRGDFTVEIQGAMQDKDLPNIYFNGFSHTVSTSDMLIILRRNDRPVAVLNASYTTAKTLSKKLAEMINELESRTNHEIMTVDDIAAKI